MPLVLTSLGLLAAYWGVLFLAQRAMLYPAPSLADAPAPPAYVQPVWLAGSAGPVAAWFLPPIPASTTPSPLIIFTHGNVVDSRRIVAYGRSLGGGAACRLAAQRPFAAAAPQAELHLLPCGHNDCAQAWTVIRDFLERHGILDGGPRAPSLPPDSSRLP